VAKAKSNHVTPVRGYYRLRDMKAASSLIPQTYSYKELRIVADLSKKEADKWVQSGVIRSELPPGHRRRVYNFESLVDGSIAKQLADFSSRELLPKMMEKFREYLKQQKINMRDFGPAPIYPRELVQIYTRVSRETIPGGGIRGVVVYVKRLDFEKFVIGKSLFITVDLNMVATEVHREVMHLK